MTKFLGMMLLVLGASGLSFAQQQVPEIDPGTAGSGLALLSGVLLVIHSRKKK